MPVVILPPLSGRIDKSNLFGVTTNQKSVPLYSAGLAWIFTKEAFWNPALLNYGKLRITYGYNGNIDRNVAAVTTITQITGLANPYSGLPFSVLTNPGNPDLRWEKTRITNLGLDFGIKDNRINGSLEVYYKKGSDLFGVTPLAPSLGYTNFTGNTADIAGNGIDLVLNFEEIKGHKFTWEHQFPAVLCAG